jgi:hypothetical protein
MTDIVVRLRLWGDSYHLHKESADEIERLRAENAKLKEALQLYSDAVHYVADVEMRKA